MDLDILKQRAKAFDYLFDAVVVTDIQGIIIDWNKGSEALYGYSKEEAVGQCVSMLHVPEDIDHVTAEVIASVEKNGKWSGEVRMLHKNGDIGWIESMCVPILMMQIRWSVHWALTAILPNEKKNRNVFSILRTTTN